MAAGLPEHIAIIPDGNRRWARERGLPPTEGHRVSYERGFEIAELAADRGIKYMTFWAFSTENWKRAENEVGFLMKLLERFVLGEVSRLHDKGFRIRFFGSREGLSAKLVAGMAEVEEKTAANTRATVNLCINYGGRLDLLEAMRQMARDGVEPESIDEELVGRYLSSHGTPPPDLIIRTSGEQRLSNYMLWESAYAELIFLDLYWPDFGQAEMEKCLAEYSRRQRRFGA